MRSDGEGGNHLFFSVTVESSIGSPCYIAFTCKTVKPFPSAYAFIHYPSLHPPPVQPARLCFICLSLHRSFFSPFTSHFLSNFILSLFSLSPCCLGWVRGSAGCWSSLSQKEMNPINQALVLVSSLPEQAAYLAQCSYMQLHCCAVKTLTPASPCFFTAFCC